MFLKYWFMLIFFSVLIYAQEIPQDSLYLGQAPPGTASVVFQLPVTPGFRPCERIAVTADGRELYYAEINTYPPSALRVKRFTYNGVQWQGPFTQFEGFMAPKLSPNDSTIYLQDNTFHTFVSRRTGTGWSTPVRLIAADVRTHYLQETAAGRLYASSHHEQAPAAGDICRLTTDNGDTLMKSLGMPLNSSYSENDFLIAPDESYILLSRNSNVGAADMFLSFRRPDGRWTNPKKLDERINRPGSFYEYGQFISHDGKYLFYTSGGTSWQSYYTYWIRIDGILDSLRHTNFVPYLRHQIPNITMDTLSAFSYQVPDSTFMDDDGNETLTYSATQSNGSPLPGWLTFDPVTRTLSGAPTSAFQISVKVTATDSANASASCTFTIKSTLTGVEDKSDLVPHSHRLYQNFPNPFNPTTQIGCYLESSETVSLMVYDLLGREVAEIYQGALSAGEHTFQFNAAQLAGGMYVYRMMTEHSSSQMKMIVLK